MEAHASITSHRTLPMPQLGMAARHMPPQSRQARTAENSYDAELQDLLVGQRLKPTDLPDTHTTSCHLCS